MLAGGGEWPNEGHFRPIEVITRPGSLFHPLPPAPTFIGGWAAHGAVDAIYRALGNAVPESVPASSGGDICSLVWWGRRAASGEPWADGSPHPVGQGASVRRDGANAVMHVSQSATRIAPTEVWESRNPWLIERVELGQDSGGAGRHRGGNGLDLDIRLLEDAEVTAVIDRTRTPPAGLSGGRAARPNGAVVTLPDGSVVPCAKTTRLAMPQGTLLQLRTGGGGGYGDPAARDPEAVRTDVREGYVSEERARADYPHAFTPRS